LEKQSTLKCYFNYNPWFTAKTRIIFRILQNVKITNSHTIYIYIYIYTCLHVPT
jgi:hypothetical protein